MIKLRSNSKRIFNSFVGRTMKKVDIQEKIRIESEIRDLFNKSEKVNTKKERLSFQPDAPPHEFDLYKKGKVIGGISTSSWRNRTGTNNSGGQDRVSTELLWLTLWKGQERRVMILSSKDMAGRLLRRWQACSFPYPIEIIYFDLTNKAFETIGTLLP